MPRRKLLEIGAMIALGVNYATAYVTAFVWQTGGPDLIIHILMMFVVSLLFGALMVDIQKTVLYTAGSIAIGISIATALIVAPPAMLTQNIELLSFDIALALHFVARLFIVGITFIIIGVIVGCFVGDALSE